MYSEKHQKFLNLIFSSIKPHQRARGLCKNCVRHWKICSSIAKKLSNGQKLILSDRIVIGFGLKKKNFILHGWYTLLKKCDLHLYDWQAFTVVYRLCIKTKTGGRFSKFRILLIFLFISIFILSCLSHPLLYKNP